MVRFPGERNISSLDVPIGDLCLTEGHRQSSYTTGMEPVLTIPHTTGTAEKRFTIENAGWQ